MSSETFFEDIPREKFVFVQRKEQITGLDLKTKPVGYFTDAFHRFVRNRGSVICGGIITVLILYALLVPFFSPYKVSDKDGYYSFALPKNMFTARLGFWDGCSRQFVNQQTYDYLENIPGAVVSLYGTEERNIAGRRQLWYKIKVDSYAKTGWVSMLLTKDDYRMARTYEQETGIHLFYPVINQDLVTNRLYRDDPNGWFLTDSRGIAKRSEKGTVENIFLKSKESSDGYAYYISRMNGAQYETRVLYREWYKYQNGHEAHFLFGADAFGYDICVRLAYGARLSLVLSVLVAGVNLFLGILIGSLEGYYGGWLDLLLERIKDILYDIPYFIFMTLFQIYFAEKLGPVVSMFVAFIFFGWIGASSTVRAQFYRFKGQEYVMAARTLGAKDPRIIFRHILPNAIGFIITTSVLTIPGVIFSEANLTYLGIVNLQSGSATSIGTMLNNGQATLSTSPHCVFFPAVFISLLLVCFNEFGNGLRDAFNPSLRGA
jgi:oligopeptide transport system permease protein